jgi:hypothetical protein
VTSEQDKAGDGEETPQGDPAAPAAAASASEVRAYLRHHPEFLLENPDLIDALRAPDQTSGDNVVDLQRFMVDRLQSEVARLTNTQGELIAATRSNMSSQAQVHEAILAAMDAESLEHFSHIVTQEFRDILGIDVVSLCLEGTPPDALERGGAATLEPGAVDELIGPERAILLRPECGETLAVFGPAAELVRSDALVRVPLDENGPAALLAFGSREIDRFHAGQGTELLGFLAQVVGRCLARWLAPQTS